MSKFLQNELLSSVKLRLNDALRQSTPDAARVLMRSSGSRERLVVTPAQAAQLQEGFATARTVPEVLVRMLGENRCPPLREFYELVLKAHGAGVLVAVDAPADRPLGVRWPVRLPAPAGLILGVTFMMAGAVGLAVLHRSWQPPATFQDFAVGWIAAGALLSLGEILAACVIAGGGEVRAVALHWKTLLPHFRTDSVEAMMGGRKCELAVAALRAAPMLAGAAVIAWKLPAAIAPALAGALYALAPWGHRPAMQWLSARHGKAKYAAETAFLFEPLRSDGWMRWKAIWWELWSKFGAVWLGWTIAWSVLLAVAVVRCVPEAATGLVAWAGTTGRVRLVLLVALYATIAVAAVAVGSLLWAGWSHWRARRAWNAPLRGADARAQELKPLRGSSAEILKQVPLFQDLDDEVIAALAAVVSAVNVEKGRRIIEEDEPGDAFYLLVEGEVEVLKRRPNSKRSTTIGWMGPGECFGEIALLENTPRTATIVAARPSRLFTLTRAGFDQQVLARVGAARLREQLQQARFIGRLAFAAGWTWDDLFAFARRCGTVRFEAGAAVLRRGAANIWFFLIFDGAFEARDGQRVLRRMGPGDYFGEISLLEDSEATADVVATEESRCLTLTRADFLELFARDFRLGLRMESAASSRLGSDVLVSR